MNYKRAFFIACAILVVLLSRMGYRRYAPRPEQIVQVPKWSSTLERVDMNAPTGCVVFIGDSHIAGLYTDNIATPSVNLGIGGDTTLGVLERIGRYQCIKTARAVVIEVGVNDLQWRGDTEIVSNICLIAGLLPQSVKVFVCSVPQVVESSVNWKPVTRHRINGFNRLLWDFIHDRSNRFRMIDLTASLGAPGIANLCLGDGIHLNRAGYQVLERSIREALISAGVSFELRNSNGPDSMGAIELLRKYSSGTVVSNQADYWISGTNYLQYKTKEQQP